MFFSDLNVNLSDEVSSTFGESWRNYSNYTEDLKRDESWRNLSNHNQESSNGMLNMDLLSDKILSESNVTVVDESWRNYSVNDQTTDSEDALVIEEEESEKNPTCSALTEFVLFQPPLNLLTKLRISILFFSSDFLLHGQNS